MQSGSHPWTVSLVKEVCWCSGRLAKKSDELTKGEFEQFTVIISIMLAHDTWSVVCLFVCLLHCYACPKCPNGSALHAESPGVDPSQQGGPAHSHLIFLIQFWRSFPPDILPISGGWLVNLQYIRGHLEGEHFGAT